MKCGNGIDGGDEKGKSNILSNKKQILKAFWLLTNNLHSLGGPSRNNSTTSKHETCLVSAPYWG